ncbi:MAG: tubulin/FtsZ family protein [Dehalococcoidia bacterium]|nr:tubulin/FtsZ family protein [Dehalococcoidia bacterium]MCL2615814.1 tubulin/FtsZ family protein [Dehalococcoidia bacterium]
MKLLVIGCGQCGGRLADEFALMSKKAQLNKLEVLTNVLAVNTDVADLSGLSLIKSDFQHRILIGNKKTGGHGVGKMNDVGAEIARSDGDKVIEAIRLTPHLAETDAFLLIAGAAGGTGSGSISVLTHMIKERYLDKPVYNMIVLPFRYEETTEERSIYNVGTCLKSAYMAADAVFLVDNQRYLKKNAPIRNNLAKINRMVVKPFYNVLCAGEETNSKYIGSKVLDAGDIIQTLSGWTVIGYGCAKTPRFEANKLIDFREKTSETARGVQAMDEALGDLSVKCNPTEARKALYLLTTNPKQMNMSLINDLSSTLKTMATEAIIRTGDYPRGQGKDVEVTVILSELTNSRKVMDYFSRTIDYISRAKQRRGMSIEQEELGETFKDIPNLL